MSRRLSPFWLALCLSAVSATSWAAGWGAILKDTVAQDFSDADLSMYLNTAQKVLDDNGPPQTVKWQNEASGAGGEFLVVGQPKRATFEQCKRVQYTIYTKRRKSQPMTLTACKKPEGRWYLV